MQQTFFFYWPLSLKGVEGHRIHIFIHLSELVSDIFFSMVIDFKKTFMPLWKGVDGFKFYLYVGFEIWRGFLWQTDNKKFLEPPNSAKWNGYFTSIIERNTNAIEKEYFRSVYCNRNVIDYIYFDPVIMITFWLHLDYFSSFWLILS